MRRRQAGSGQMRRRGRGGGGGGSSDLSAVWGTDLLAWLLADDSAMSLNGSNVASWPNRASNGAASQATGSAQPFYSATSFNGGPGITGSASRWMAGAFTSQTVAIGERATMWVVFKLGVDTNTNMCALRQASDNASSMALFQNLALTINGAIRCLPATSDVITGLARDTNIHLGRTAFRTTTTDRMKFDDTSYAGTLTTAGARAGDAMSLFCTGLGNSPGDATIGEFVIVRGDTGLYPEKETATRRYFKNRYYGLTLTP